MPAVTLREVPDNLHAWIKAQAAAHHRSVNKEVIALLDGLRKGQTTRKPLGAADILHLARQCAALPELDGRSAEAIIGYDEHGLPG